MRRYGLSIAVVVCLGATLSAEEPNQDELLKAGDRFLKELPKNFETATRREYFELTSFGKFLGVIDARVRWRPSAERDQHTLEYDAIIRYPDGTRVTSRGKATADASFCPLRNEVHQKKDRTDGASMERIAEVDFGKHGIDIKRNDPHGKTENRLPRPDGPFVTINNYFIEAIAAAKVESLAIRDFDPERYKFVTKRIEAKPQEKGLMQVEVTKAGESEPSETYIVGKKGRVLRVSKGGKAEAWRRINEEEFLKLKKKLEAPHDGKRSE